MGLMKVLFGNYNKRELKRIKPLCDKVLALEPTYRAMSEEELRGQTAKLKARLAAGETVLVAAHGNSLRAIVKHLFGVPDEAIVDVEIPTGNPLLVELDAGLKPVSARYLDEGRAQALPRI